MRRPFEGDTVQQVIYAPLDGTYQPLRSFRPQLSPVLSRWVEGLRSRPPGAASGWCGGGTLASLQKIRHGQPVVAAHHLKALLPAKAQPWTPLAEGR